MSRAFVKEPDGADAFEELPERPVSPHPNYVTARGLASIDAAIVRHRDALTLAQKAEDRAAAASASRELRYWTARRASAELLPPARTTETVRFGLSVTVERDDGRVQRFRIVGEDEADPANGLISYVSPLARALIGRQLGDTVAAGQGEAEILAIEAVPDEA